MEDLNFPAAETQADHHHHQYATDLAQAAQAAAHAAGEMMDGSSQAVNHNDNRAAASNNNAIMGEESHSSLPNFELNGGEAVNNEGGGDDGGVTVGIDVDNPSEGVNNDDDAFLHPSHQYNDDDNNQHRYTSTNVPVSPMQGMEHQQWNHHHHNEHHLQDNVSDNGNNINSSTSANNAATASVVNAAPTTHPNTTQTMQMHSPIQPTVNVNNAPSADNNNSNNDNNQQQPPTPSNNNNNNEAMYASYAIPPQQQQPQQYGGYASMPPPPPHHHHPPHPAHYIDHNQQLHPHYQHWPPMYGLPPHQGYGVVPPHHLPPSQPTSSRQSNKNNNAHHNSNFWLQEEEERFLLGLRLYGWGQWKRIQTVVQTRSNKQIKSHAQKREKVNPDIKFKYAKGKSRRGRVSTKLLEGGTGYTSGSVGSGATVQVVGGLSSQELGLDDPTLPPMEELWKDVYGTNNGVGPNSRLRRYRSNALHQKWLEEVGSGGGGGDKSGTGGLKEEDHVALCATEKTKDGKKGSGKGGLTPEGQYIQDHKVLQPPPSNPSNAAHQQQQQQQGGGGGQPMYYPPPHPSYMGYGMAPPPGYSPARGYPSYHSMQQHPQGSPLQQPPLVHQPHTPATPATPASLSSTVTGAGETLRPGMRIYARRPNNNNSGPTWSPGTIYSAKVDPSKQLDANSSTVPLVYHIQYDGGEEDIEVPEEDILSMERYDRAIDELERHYDLYVGTTAGSTAGKSNLEAGVPVYARWMERSNPNTHGRWLPGTIGSVREEETVSGSVVRVYHILFDNATEKKDVTHNCVLDRNEYHELVKRKQHTNVSKTPIREVYSLFSRGEEDAANGVGGQGMDLLFTASQMAAPMDTSRKREAEQHQQQMGDVENPAKRVKTEEGEGKEQEPQSQLEEPSTEPRREEFALV